MSKVYTGDTGTVISLDCGQDISAATARSIEARKPSGSVVTWPATADGATAIKVITDAAMLDQPGTWRLQALVTIGAGRWRGETVGLQVCAEFA